MAFQKKVPFFWKKKLRFMARKSKKKTEHSEKFDFITFFLKSYAFQKPPQNSPAQKYYPQIDGPFYCEEEEY